MSNGPAAIETRHLRTLFALGAAGCLTDGQLLERFATLHGDPAELAFATLVERHGPMVLRVARSALVDEHSAHDAFQATFLILARKARSLWVRDSLGPWLHAVAYRVASQTRSTEARRRLVEKDAARPEAHHPHDRDRSDLARAIHQEIDRLPQPYRLAVVTCHLEGLTQHDAANRLGWPVGTLQSRLARGRERLRDRLQRRGLAPSLGVLDGKFSPVPHALTVSTARAAATLQLGGTAAGMIAPAVLALIETTTKGMLMTKLKLGAVALVMIGGLVGSGMGLGSAGMLQRPMRPAAKAPEARPVEPQKTGAVIGGTSLVLEPQPAEADESPSGSVQPPVPKKWRQARLPSPAAEIISPPSLDQPSVIRPPAFPVLLSFHADWAGPCQQMRPEIEKLIKAKYPVERVDIDRSPELPGRYKVTSIPTFLVVDSDGKELARTEGVVPASQLAAWYNHVAASRNAPSYGQVTPIADPPSARSREAIQPDNHEPSLTDPITPRPWETVVRIKVHISDNEWSFGSGTIIFSSAEESIILTHANLFRTRRGRTQPRPVHFRLPISVDLFGGQFVQRQPSAMLACKLY